MLNPSPTLSALAPSAAPATPVLPFPWWKRTMDIAGCILALPLLGALLLGAAVIIRLRSPGPLFFHQVRIGHGRRPFILFKIRTMTPGADPETHAAHLSRLVQEQLPLEKLDARGDARLLPGAVLLRAAGLDEIPQILNVLRGEMSLIGPRPCLPAELDHYPPDAAPRFAVRPGLTGLWQVSGKNRTTFAEMIRLDVEYATRLSFWRDVQILLRTVPALCREVADVGRRRARAAALRNRSAFLSGLGNASSVHTAKS